MEKIMKISLKLTALTVIAAVTLTACGGSGSGSLGGIGKSVRDSDAKAPQTEREAAREARSGKLSDLFTNSRADEVGAINKYLWNASLDVLSFLPLESADPFTGVITFGNGRAPGSSQVYRATVLITDPALDARALKVSVLTSRGAASAETQRQIENAILSRARQLRISRAKL
tara:strand:- start:33182 stop:33700 length:519 start_codon:yes stop_codon:yes gene_type:complete